MLAHLFEHDAPVELIIGFSAGWLFATFLYAYLCSLRHKRREEREEREE